MICVRLAVFAEMMKDQPWTEANLDRVGGTSGIGLTFLEQTFNTRTAPARYRIHQTAIRSVLQSLLPEHDIGIKRGRRSFDELLTRAEYAEKPDAFAEVLKVLDGELRLISPAEAQEQREALHADADLHAPRYFQLSHDFLVPPLTAWLTQKRRETPQGRAAIRLEERTAEWMSKRESRRLPSLGEWTQILRWTKKQRWTDSQREMMVAARRKHTTRLGVFGLVATLLLTVAGVTRQRFQQATREEKITGLVNTLTSADITEVPGIAGQFAPLRESAYPRLESALAEQPTDSMAFVNLNLALVDARPASRSYLTEYLLKANPGEVGTLVKRLEPFQDQIVEQLWRSLENGSDAVLLRSASALASFAPESDRWQRYSERIANALVTSNPLRAAVWMEHLKPIRRHLVPRLGIVFRGDGSQAQIDLATRILEVYAVDDLDSLSELLLDSNESQFNALFDAFAGHGSAVWAKLKKELDHEPKPTWNDEPIAASWKDPSPDLVRMVEDAKGIVGERFAFCQTLPLKHLFPVADKLAEAGYRPIKIRPYAHGDDVSVAVTWNRDGRPWELRIDQTAEQVRAEHEMRNEHWVAVDLAGYVSNLGTANSGIEKVDRYAILWTDSNAKVTDSAIYLSEDSEDEDVDEKLEQRGFPFQNSMQGFLSVDGTNKYCGVRWPLKESTWRFRSYTTNTLERHTVHHAVEFGLSPMSAPEEPDTVARYSEKRSAAEKRLEENPGTSRYRFDRAIANFRLGEDRRR